MRHRRVWLLLTCGVVVLVILHYTNKEFNSTEGEKHRRNGINYRNKARKLEPAWWKEDKNKIASGKNYQNSDRENLKRLKPGPVVEDCSLFAQKEAQGDINSNKLWNTLTLPENSRYMSSNYWVSLRYNKTDLHNQPKLKVFVMPHSHADPGWLKTYLQYSLDTNAELNNMLEYLPSHRNMTFTWNEVAFFEKWWKTLNTPQQETVKTLIKRGQLELTSGSWTMTDEASPYFWASIDNIVEGHQFLIKEIGDIPRMEWSNDPFGYGPTVPYLFHKAGINRLALNRVHKQIKMYLEMKQSAVFNWRQFWDPEGKNDVLAHLLPFLHYDVPNSCGPDPGVCCQFDFKRLTHYYCPGPKPVPITQENVAERAMLLMDQYRKTSRMYRHNVILILLGDDFRYTEKAEFSQQHDNYMTLFDYMNGRPDWNIQAKFGTFSEYFDALEERTQNKVKESFPVVAGDFFPYNDFVDHYWTGYYTTRPFWKRLDRVVQSYIRAADIFSALAFAQAGDRVSEETQKMMLQRLTEGRRNVALFQHHDAITGTSKWPVVTDYGVRLYTALLDASDVLAASTELLLTKKQLSVPLGKHLADTLDFGVNEMPPAFNMSEVKIPLAFDKETSVVLVNSLPHWRVEVVRLHVNSPMVTVESSSGKVVLAQINPVLGYEGGVRKDLFQLIFLAELAPLSLKKFVVRRESRQPVSTAVAEVFMTPMLGANVGLLPDVFNVKPVVGESIELGYQQLKTRHNKNTGLLEEVTYGNGAPRKMKLEFYHYENTQSGAYLFMPVQPAKPWTLNASTVFHVKGKLVSEVHSFLPRIHHNLAVLNVQNEAGKELYIRNTVDLRNVRNTELIMRLDTDVVTSDNSFHTDHMGLQILKRKFHPNQRVETNYYPISTAIILDNDKERLTVLCGHGHGGTRPKMGTLEIMLDRILTRDDGKGLGADSLVRDNLPGRSEFKILLENKKSKEDKEEKEEEKRVGRDRKIGQELEMDGEGEATSLYHSISAFHSLQRMLYPTFVLHDSKMYAAQQTNNNQEQINRESPSNSDMSGSYSPIHSAFPCDFQLISVRPLPDAAEKNSRLIIEHRPGIDCSLPLASKFGCQDSSKDSIKELLDALMVGKLFETQLSGVKIKQEITDFSTVADIEPMDVRSYRMVLNSKQ